MENDDVAAKELFQEHFIDNGSILTVEVFEPVKR